MTDNFDELSAMAETSPTAALKALVAHVKQHAQRTESLSSMAAHSATKVLMPLEQRLEEQLAGFEQRLADLRPESIMDEVERLKQETVDLTEENERKDREIDRLQKNTDRLKSVIQTLLPGFSEENIDF